MHRFLTMPAAAGLLLTLAFGVAAATPDAQAERFRSTDSNGDGFVDLAEQRAAVQREFETIDGNRDGFLDQAEYAKHLAASVQGALPAQALQSVARCYIRGADRNGDGKLSLDEQQAHGLRFFKALDSNGDGRLTLEESKRPPDPKAIGPQPVCD